MKDKGTLGEIPGVPLYFFDNFGIISVNLPRKGGEVWMSRYIIWTRW